MSHPDKISLRQMSNSGVTKRTDAYSMDINLLQHKPDFNPPGRTITDFDKPLEDEDDIELYQHIISGGYLTPIQFWRENGVNYIADGNRRKSLIERAIKHGEYPMPDDGIVRVAVVKTDASDIDLLANIVVSNKNKPLSAIDRAYVYKAMYRKGATLQEIAKKVQKSISHVQQAISLANADQAVINAVQSGEMSASVAIDLVRTEGRNAGNVVAATKAKGEKLSNKNVLPRITDKRRIVFLQGLIDSRTIEDFTRGKGVVQFLDGLILKS